MKHWRIVLLFALVAIFALWIQWWASSGFPLEHQICGEGEAKVDCASYNIILYSAWALAKAADHWGVLITALASAAIAIFTLTLWLASEKMWDATKQSVDLARDEFRSTHRPKIRVKHVRLANDLEPDKFIIIDITCVNTGATEARLREIGLRYEVVPKGRLLQADASINPVLRGNLSEFPIGVNVEVPGLNIGRAITAAEYAAIQTHASNLFCVGYVSYLDAANHTRITGFCRVLKLTARTIKADNSRFRIFDDPDYEYQD